MPRSFPFPGRRGSFLAILVTTGLLAAAAAPAEASSIFDLVLSSESELVPSVGAPAPLVGTLRVEIGQVPVTSATTIRLLDANVSGGGVTAILDPTIPSAGLGVLSSDGSFLFPSLFLVVDAGAGPLDLVIQDLVGTAEFTGLSRLRVATSFAIDTLGPEGVVTVDLVAVPEPSSALATCLGLIAIASWRARQEGSR